jgi:integrase
VPPFATRNMRGQFKVTLCVHRRNKYLVTGYANGKRIRKFFRTKVEAETSAALHNQELQNFGHELSVMPNALRTVAMVWSKRLAPFGMTIERACQDWIDRNDWRSKSVLVKDGIPKFFVERDREFNADEIAERTHETSRSRVKKLLPDFGSNLICDLSPEILNKWLITQPVMATTRNNIRRDWSVFFAFAVKNQWVEKNPIAEVKPANTKRIKAARKVCVYTPEQAEAVLFHADYDLLPFFAIGMFAGLRTSEIERLDWRHILWDERLIDVEGKNSKTGKPRFVPMTDNLVAWLAPYRNSHGPVALREPPFKRSRRKAVRDRAGIPADMDNAMRHSYCSYHFNLHDDAPETSKNAGHMTPTVLFSNYHHRVKKTACERYFAIFPRDAQNILKVA